VLIIKEIKQPEVFQLLPVASLGINPNPTGLKNAERLNKLASV
jgi:hypothetical protein